MSSSWKHVTRRMSIACCSLLLVVLLAACGGSGNNGTGSATATPAATQAPTATATPAAPAVTMKTYTGTDYSISYPSTWQVTSSNGQAANQVAIQDATTGNGLTIVGTPDPNGVSSADSLASISAQTIAKSVVKNGQVTSLSSVTLNGVTWAQRQITGTITLQGQDVPAKIILLVATHPANSATTKAYQLFYGGPTATFDQANTLAFQPMLQSFKFTA